jgi:hypothetical protein
MKLTTSIITLAALALTLLAAAASTPAPSAPTSTPAPPAASSAPAAKDVKVGNAPKAEEGKASPDATAATTKDKAETEDDNGAPSFAHVSAALCVLAGITAVVA